MPLGGNKVQKNHIPSLESLIMNLFMAALLTIWGVVWGLVSGSTGQGESANLAASCIVNKPV